MTTFKVYYMKPEHFRDGICGLNRPTVATLSDTHVFLRTVTLDEPAANLEWALEKVFMMSQGEFWSPNGEARPLIAAKGLRHTSMSTGDVIADENDHFHIVATVGFERLN